MSVYMGGCQNYGIKRTRKGTMILTTTHMVVARSSNPGSHQAQQQQASQAGFFLGIYGILRVVRSLH